MRCILSDISKKRNFSIIAHVDHGKSTLADRLIETTGVVSKREMQEQLLDNMDLERERGITIKLQTIKLMYKADDGNTYELNLIDTPGHVDFNYEVSRSLAACEGALLVVDAAQGVEAQTLANVYLALDEDLEILPIINKIDLPSANVDMVKEEIENIIGLDTQGVPLISAKTGLNIHDVLEDIVKKVPSPKGSNGEPLKALIFDSYYDAYKGVIAFVRVFDGTVKQGDEILMMHTNKHFEVTEVGVISPTQIPVKTLEAGDVGYISASIKDIRSCRVGDTITNFENPTSEPLAGYQKANPMVYCGIYPAEGEKYEDLKDSLEKLQINDAALEFEPETSIALGFGYRCGFLGLLHMDIIRERLEREFDLAIISTAPSVMYKVIKTDGEVLMIQNPTNMPSATEVSKVEEPIVRCNIMTPKDYVGTIMELAQSRRGEMIDMQYLDEFRVSLEYHIPLNEVVFDFFDALKSRTRGYGSMDYEFLEYKESELVKLDILINKEKVDALSFLVHESQAESRGRKICERLKDEIPKHQFVVPIQAAVGNKIIARETISAYRKDVLSKCYGGDISRKRKLLEKQKEGKKKMRQVGNVEIPQTAFMSILKIDE